MDTNNFNKNKAKIISYSDLIMTTLLSSKNRVSTLRNAGVAATGASTAAGM